MVVAVIAAKHTKPMKMITFRRIIKEWDIHKTRMLTEAAENECAGKRQLAERVDDEHAANR